MKYKDCDCFFEYINFKDDLIEHKFLCCNKIEQDVTTLSNQKKFDQKLKKRLFNTYKFSGLDINKFTLLLLKRCLPL